MRTFLAQNMWRCYKKKRADLDFLSSACSISGTLSVNAARRCLRRTKKRMTEWAKAPSSLALAYKYTVQLMVSWRCTACTGGFLLKTTNILHVNIFRLHNVRHIVKSNDSVISVVTLSFPSFYICHLCRSVLKTSLSHLRLCNLFKVDVESGCEGNPLLKWNW